MDEYGAYGARMAACLHLKNAPSITVRTLRKSNLAVTRLRSDTGLPEKTGRIPAEKAFLVSLQLRPLSGHKLWLGGKPVAVTPYPEGGVSIVDLEHDPTAVLSRQFDVLQFYVPRATLNELTDEHGAPRIENLCWPRGAFDPVVKHLGLAILPAIQQPSHACRIFLDYAVYALHSHIARTYGGMQIAPPVARGGLAPWQMNRAREILMANLDGDVSLPQVASECELSVSRFARAFKQTTGHPPHRWLILRRMDKARELLLRSPLPLVDVALRCGFADQAAFTRSFTRMIGTSPGGWRRMRRAS